MLHMLIMFFCFLLFFLGGICLEGVAGMSLFVANVVSFIIAFVLWVMLSLLVDAKEKSTTKNMTYDKRTQTLTITHRAKINKRAIEVEQIKDYDLKYVPPKTVYTGATVGGIHMGGFHETGNYYLPKTFPTDKFQLIYNIGAELDHGPVRIIKLTPALVEEAKSNSKISKFLNEEDSTLVLSHDDNARAEQRGFADAARLGRMDIAQKMAKLGFIKSQLNILECNDIRNWIAGKN